MPDSWYSLNIILVKGSSDEFIDANIQLALAVVRKLHDTKGTRSCIVSFYLIAIRPLSFSFYLDDGSGQVLIVYCQNCCSEQVLVF